MHALRRLFLAALVHATSASAADLDALGADGVYTWRVAAVDDAPAWCCMRWYSGSPVRESCDLDSGRSGYGTMDGFPRPDGFMQLYVVIENGDVERLRTLSPRCEVRSRREITNLGVVDVDESLAWLKTKLESNGNDVLPAVAVHTGDKALGFLADMANGGRTLERRKDAIFWMSQLRIREAADDVERLMFRDPLAEIRKHAAFSMAESDAANRQALLVRQGRDDDDPDVRSGAWFWLAQTGVAESEREIRQALDRDSDPSVREGAVFALSQLPGERAVDALLAVLHDRDLDRPVRERALFWLVQSDSERAYEYLDRLLAGIR